MAEFQLGRVYRDQITGVVGVAIGIYSDISGEQSVTLQPPSIDGSSVATAVRTNLKFLQEGLEDQAPNENVDSTDE